MMELKRVIPSLKQGNEEFEIVGVSTGWRLIEFWRWNTSDLVSNVTRGRVAEFIVAKALNIDTNVSRDEWSAFDLLTTDGIKVEVKSSAFIQSWTQKTPSKISFRIRKTREWNSETNIQSKTEKRQADVYVFALLFHQEKETINPLNIDQWIFYVLSSRILDERKRSKYSITLPSLKKLNAGPIPYSKLEEKVKEAAHMQLIGSSPKNAFPPENNFTDSR